MDHLYQNANSLLIKALINDNFLCNLGKRNNISFYQRKQ